MLRILTKFFKKFKRKFGVEILAKLNNKISNISRIYTRKKRIHFFFPISLSKNGESSAVKKKTLFLTELVFFPRCFWCVSFCMCFLKPATNSFLMEEKFHDGSSMSRRRRLPLFLCCNFGTVI